VIAHRDDEGEAEARLVVAVELGQPRQFVDGEEVRRAAAEVQLDDRAVGVEQRALQRDLALEVPRSPLEAVMANEVWSELYDRLAELIQSHRTTLIFVNNRRLAERATRHLAERVGVEHVATHHGSLSKEHRLRAETRLKEGSLKALIATSSLELGIDIGDIDLVCQMGSPRLISAFLQRVGRAGHAIGAIPNVPFVRLKPPKLSPFRTTCGMISPNPSVTIAR